jgi:hypothetical protein
MPRQKKIATVHPGIVYLVVPRHGGPVFASSWSYAHARRCAREAPGDFVVRKYVAAQRMSTTDDVRNRGGAA